MGAWETRAQTQQKKAGTTRQIKTDEHGWGHDPKITHGRDKRFMRIRCESFRPLAPSRFLQDGIPWGRPGLALLNYNNIIPKQGRNYPTLFFTEENRGVVPCFNPS